MKPARSAVVILVAASACGAPENHAANGAHLGAGKTPSWIASGEGTIRRIEERASVALTGPRVDAKPGDWVLENAGSVAVVSDDGRVIDFGSKGGRDEITAIDPLVFLGLDAAHVEPVSSEVVGDGHVLHVVRKVLEKPILLHVFVSLVGDRLRLETTVTASGPMKGAIAITLGEEVGWSNVPTWVGGHGFVRHAGTFVTDLLARDSEGVAYAACSETGKLVARFGPPESGFFEGATTGESPEIVPADGSTGHRVIAIARASGSVGAAAAKLPCGMNGPLALLPMPASLPPSAHVDVARCPEPRRDVEPGPPATPEPWVRFALGEAARLPAGCYRMRLTAPGHAGTAWFPANEIAQHALTPAGSLRFEVKDAKSHRALPARVLVRGAQGTPDPDWGDDAKDGAALNVVYAERGAGERLLPAGRYTVTIGRGFEYTAVEREIAVDAGKPTDLAVELDRVVDTHGFITADMHLHAMPSPDAIQPLADRIRALVATGVEVGVATDHNKVTDYKPVIQELGIAPWIASIVGDEITTRDPAWGHFNAFPLPAGSAPLLYRGATPTQIYAAARGAGTLGKDTIVQVNHPRMSSIGYFDLVRFDRDDVEGWKRRVPVGDLGFDAIEVFNGDHYANIGAVEDVMRDWYALLDAGMHVTATGNSDSHKLTFHEPGVPRNLVAMANDDPAAFDEKAFIAAVRAGKVTVSSGPFVRLTANGKGLGETVPEGEVTLVVEVDAPPWVDVDRVEIVKRGEVVATWKAPFPEGKLRLAAQSKQTLRAGDWVIAIARGSKPMSYLYRSGATPFAFTNPIWIGKR